MTLRVPPFSAAFKIGSSFLNWPSRLGRWPMWSTEVFALTEKTLLSIISLMFVVWFCFSCDGAPLMKIEVLFVPISHQKLRPTSSVSGTPKTKNASFSEALSVHSRSCARLVAAVDNRANNTRVRRKRMVPND